MSTAPTDAGAHECGPACQLPSGACVEAWIEAHPEGATLDEVAREFNLTRERIRQIERDALIKIRIALACDTDAAIDRLEQIARAA